MNKNRIIVAILLILLLGAGIWYFFYKKDELKVLVLSEKPQYGYLSKTVTATGTIEPVDTVSVGTQVSGTIAKIYTDFNARVRKGQLIAEMDKSLFQAQVDQYKANLEVAKATLAYEKKNYDRQSLLFKTGAIDKADEETAEDQYLTAKATVASVQAQLNGAVKNLFYASIYSPVNGVVLLRNISVGQTVAASFNTPTLFIIAKDITKMQVQAAVDEADIGEVADSQRVIFTVDAYPDISFKGKVNQIRLEPVVSANVVTYTTIVTAPNDDLKLKPGMTANIFIFTKEVNNAMLIPAKAIKFRPAPSLAKQYKIIPLPTDKKPSQNGEAATDHAEESSRHGASNLGLVNPVKNNTAFVWTLQGDTLKERLIHTGLNDDTHVEVLDGLTAVDAVVTGISTGGKKGATVVAAPPKSPFMPTRTTSKPAPRH
jgi:HlyD family secretion protein